MENIPAIERVWNKVANHYGKSPKWNGWQCRFLKLRKDDPLIAYLINARGAEEHTVDEIVGREGGGIGINPAVGNSLYIEYMVINGPNVSIKSPQAIRNAGASPEYRASDSVGAIEPQH